MKYFVKLKADTTPYENNQISFQLDFNLKVKNGFFNFAKLRWKFFFTVKLLP